MISQPLAGADLATLVLAQPSPILFLDTAAILDIARVPFRHELQVDIINSAATAVDHAHSEPRRIWLVTTANVMQEFGSRRDDVTAELQAHMRDLSLSIARVLNIAKTVLPERQIRSFDLLDMQFEQRLLGILDRLVDSMIVFRGTPACIARARDRVWAGMPPASKGRQEFKDCEIFEEFLEFLWLVRGHGVMSPAVFVTPNKQDYGPPPDGHPQINSDLAASGAQYAANLSWALSLLRP